MKYLKTFENISDPELDGLVEYFSDLDLEFDCYISGSRGLTSIFSIEIKFDKPSEIKSFQIFPEILNRISRLKSIGEFDIYVFPKSNHLGVLRFDWLGGGFYESDGKHIGLTEEILSNPKSIGSLIENQIRRITGWKDNPLRVEDEDFDRTGPWDQGGGYLYSINSMSLYFKKSPNRYLNEGVSNEQMEVLSEIGDVFTNNVLDDFSLLDMDLSFIEYGKSTSPTRMYDIEGNFISNFNSISIFRDYYLIEIFGGLGDDFDVDDLLQHLKSSIKFSENYMGVKFDPDVSTLNFKLSDDRNRYVFWASGDDKWVFSSRNLENYIRSTTLYRVISVKFELFFKLN